MEIFLSWSGARSKTVAEALRKWLPGVLQSVNPWASGADIEAGARWHQALSLRLNECNFGIICVTPENLGSNWLLYEAGALSKAVEGSSVVPYLVGLRKVDVEGPLAHFQGVEADVEGTYSLLKAMNAVLPRLNERPLTDDTLRQAFDLWWPKLDETLQSARAAQISTPATRSSDEMIQELVENTRSIAGAVATLTNRLEASGHAKPVATHTPTSHSLIVEPEVLQATRTVLTKLIDDLDSDVYNSDMTDAVQRWRSVVENPKAPLETLNEALRGAKSLREYLDR